MVMRILLLLAVVVAVHYCVLKRRNIQITLSPLGKSTLLMAVRAALRLLMRRIGF